jgi:Glycosyl transferase family 2
MGLTDALRRGRRRSKLPRAPVAEAPLPHATEEFHGGLRHTRRERYESRTPPRPNRRAVVTMVHNEAAFLPVWLGYYSRFFAPQDIYVLDNDSTDGSTERDGFVRIPVAHDSVDHEWMVSTIAGHQRELLERYEVVVVTDVDEIVAPLPECGTLGEYLDRFDEEWVNCLGYEIVHLRDIEPPYDPARPILDQRGWWFANGAYDKPAIATVEMSWRPGFHARTDGQINLDPDLRLIHLHRLDYDICRARHVRRRDRAWKAGDVDAGWAAYNRITETRRFDDWFYGESGFEDEGIEMRLEPIPESWRGVF